MTVVFVHEFAEVLAVLNAVRTVKNTPLPEVIVAASVTPRALKSHGGDQAG